jgi:surfeit locus 1 family protein
MHHKMPLKIKNWKLLLLAIVFIAVFTRLGIWQLARAQEKATLLQSFSLRMTHPPLLAPELSQIKDWRFYPTQLKGKFDNAHSLLLDNKIYEGKIGYEVYTPFQVEDFAAPILVDRGFIPIGKDRRSLPLIKPILGEVTIKGMLNLPPQYVSLGKMVDKTSSASWPLRIEFVDLKQIASLLGYPLYPYIINIDPTHPAAYVMKWQIVTMGPEKHKGYAVQWFALAITLLILSVTLNFKR